MLVGAYTEYNSMFGVALLLGSGLFGYWMKKLDFPVAPLVLTLVIGPLMEQSFIRTLEMYPHGVQSVFLRPLVSVLLLAAIAVVIFFSVRTFGAADRFVRADSE